MQYYFQTLKKGILVKKSTQVLTINRTQETQFIHI